MEFIKYQQKEIPIAENLKGTAKNTSSNPKKRKAVKFNRMANIASNLESFETKLYKILETKKIEDKKIAYSVLLMLETGIRSGNEDSAEGYVCNIKNHPLIGQTIQTYGITTLKKEHIKIEGDELKIEFLGKKAVEQNLIVKNPQLVKWGKWFLENSPNDTWLNIERKELKDWIKKTVGKNYMIKDFRTVRANLTAGTTAEKLIHNPKTDKKKVVLGEVKEIVQSVADQLGNTPSISRSSYINPEILDWFIHKRMPKLLIELRKKQKEKERKAKLRLKQKAKEAKLEAEANKEKEQ